MSVEMNKDQQDLVATLLIESRNWWERRSPLGSAKRVNGSTWGCLKSQYDGKAINGYTVSFIEHNCTNESDEVSQLMDKYNIEGYPTIKLLKDNQVIEYDAKPTKSTMEQFLHTVL